jgi:hypothetical protein
MAALVTSSESPRPSSSTIHTPSAIPRRRSAADRSARRVLPTPPGPTSVTRRAALSAGLTSWSSRRRPMKLDSSAGRFPRVAVALAIWVAPTCEAAARVISSLVSARVVGELQTRGRRGRRGNRHLSQQARRRGRERSPCRGSSGGQRRSASRRAASSRARSGAQRWVCQRRGERCGPDGVGPKASRH